MNETPPNNPQKDTKHEIYGEEAPKIRTGEPSTLPPYVEDPWITAMIDRQNAEDAKPLEGLQSKELEQVSVEEMVNFLVEKWPQLHEGYPTYIFTGSFALRLALLADAITEVKIEEVDSDHPPVLRDGETLFADPSASEPESFSSLPKDIDVLPGDYSSSYEENPRWYMAAAAHSLVPKNNRRFIPFGTTRKEMLIEDFDQHSAIPKKSLHFTKWGRVRIGTKEFLIQNPTSIIGIRGLMTGKDKIQTAQYLEALRQRWPKMFERKTTRDTSS